MPRIRPRWKRIPSGTNRLDVEFGKGRWGRREEQRALTRWVPTRSNLHTRGGEDEAGEGGKETEMFATGKVRDFARLFIPGFPHIPASWKALASLATQERGEGWGRKRNGRMDREDFSFSLRFGANLSARQWLRIFLFVFFFRVFWGEFWLVLDLLFGVSGILVGVRFVSKRIRDELKVMEEEAEDFIRLLSRYWPSFCGQPFARWLLVKFRLEGSTSFQVFHDK